MNILFVASIVVALAVLARWILVYFRPGIVGELNTHQSKAKLPPLPPTTDTIIAGLPEVDVRTWLEGARVPPSPSIELGLLGLDEDREAEDIAIWRTVRRVLATRREAKVATEKS